jgi:hypothetical protein
LSCSQNGRREAEPYYQRLNIFLESAWTHCPSCDYGDICVALMATPEPSQMAYRHRHDTTPIEFQLSTDSPFHGASAQKVADTLKQHAPNDNHNKGPAQNCFIVLDETSETEDSAMIVCWNGMAKEVGTVRAHFDTILAQLPALHIGHTDIRELRSIADESGGVLRVGLSDQKRVLGGAAPRKRLA